MPSIRDWRAKRFDAATDWFSWGVLAFQVFVGIHPYKGKLDGYRPGDLERRMRDNASIFASGVRLPHSARDLGCIPAPLMEWFHAEFQDGARTAPPSPLDRPAVAAAALVLRASIGPEQGLVHEKVFAHGASAVVRVWPCGVGLLASRELVDPATGRGIGALMSPDAEVIRVADGWLLADLRDGRPALFHAPFGIQYDYEPGRTTALDLGLAMRRFFRADDRLFAVTDRELVELTVGALLDRPVLTMGRRWGARPNATRWFDGVAVQDVLGAAFLMLPTATGMVQARTPELDGLVPVAGCGNGRFAAVVASDRAGVYHRIELTFAADHGSYTAWRGPNDGPDLNMVALPTGVVATVVEDGEVVIFVPANGNVRKVRDRGIATDVRLSRWDGKVVYLRDGDLWTMRVR